MACQLAAELDLLRRGGLCGRQFHDASAQFWAPSADLCVAGELLVAELMSHRCTDSNAARRSASTWVRLRSGTGPFSRSLAPPLDQMFALISKHREGEQADAFGERAAEIAHRADHVTQGH